MNGLLSGKRAVIIGASRGIGAACTLEFCKQGAQVVVASRRVSESDIISCALPGLVGYTEVDVTVPERMDDLYDEVKHGLGEEVDVLLYCAGRMVPQRLGEIDQATFDAQVMVNAWGVVAVTQKLLPLFNPGAVVIVPTPVWTQSGSPGLSAYTASKAAGGNLGISWHGEQPGIRFIAVLLGPVDTPALDALGRSPREKAQVRAHLAATTPRGRLSSAQDVAASIALLASDGAKLISGVVDASDGWQYRRSGGPWGPEVRVITPEDLD